MNIFNIFTPHILYTIGAIFCFFLFIFPTSLFGGVISVFIFHKASLKKNKQIEPSKILGLSKDHMMKFYSIFGMVLILIIYSSAFLFFTDFWIHANPSPSWKNEIKSTDTAIILGFGYTKGPKGQMKAGKANEFLLDWTLKNTQANTILVQEGVWLAACPKSAQTCEISGRKIYRIHKDVINIDVNTLEACYCAIEQMEALGKKKAIIIAHDLQLERAAWDMIKIKNNIRRWSHFQFIIPEIPDTPFPENSGQWRTCNSLVYKFIELFLSRTRDFISSTPRQCIAPLNQLPITSQ